MKCPRCQAANRESARFCEDCGARLAVVCPSCGVDVTPGKRFCASCGAALTAGQPQGRFTSPQSYTPRFIAEKILTSRSALEGERKQVTVLFADMRGSTELLADRDPEDARKILDPVLELMMEAVHRYEGTVNQVMGDGIMALFGAPLALEDHAVRACYAALRMQESVRRYAEGVRRTEGFLVQIRVGLNAGEVVVRSIGSDLHMDYTAVGQTTHLAARMEQAAAPGSILLTAHALRLAEGYVQVKPLGPLQLKGLADPVEAFEVTGAGPVRTRLQAAAARGLTRFVGRDAEIGQLRQALDQAREGHGQVVAVVGEPGVGKSRLFYEFVHSHRTHGWLVLESASVSHGKATAYLPVIDLLRSYLRIDGRDDGRAIRAKATGTLLTLDPSLEDAVPAVLALLDALPPESPFLRLEPAQRRQLTLGAVKRLLLRESQVQPLLLVFEDLHWIDSETQAVLDGLVESLPSAAVLLAMNYRPEYSHRWGNKTYYRQLRIDPLPPESAGELLQHLVGADPGLEPLKAFLIARTEGNPFFLEESVRTLVETGALAGERGAYRLTRAVSSLQVPASVHAILAARIDRLGPEDKPLLQAAAVVGKDVPLILLQGVSDLDENGVTLGLTRLQAAEFLYETSLFPEPEYTFKHALTHEVAYGSLLAERRRALHARVVETIEARFADRLPEHVEQLAHHAFRGEVWDRAVLYMRQAGQKAASHSAHREAAACFDQALAALGHLPDSREAREQAIDLRLELRSSLFTTGELSRIPGLLAEAEAIATAIGDGRRLAIILNFLSNHYFEMGDKRASDCAERALAIAREVGDPGLQGLATFGLGRNLYSLGEYRRAIELLGTAVTALHEHLPEAHLAGPTGFAGGLPFLSRAFSEVGEFEQAMARAEEAMQVSEAADHALGRVHAQFALGFAHLRKGDLERAVPPFERGLDLARTKAVSFLDPLMCAAVGSAYAMSGRLADGLPLLELGVGGAIRMGHPGFVSWLQGWLAEGYLLVERRADAIATAMQSLDISRRTRRRGNEAHVLRVLGDIAASAQPPQIEEAEGHYRASLALAVEREMRPLVARCHHGLGSLYRRTGESVEARAHLTSAASMYREMEMRSWLQKAERELGELG
jgi:class 3 adenylate cyclase/tetratricopeptide (TPR) repeat protein